MTQYKNPFENPDEKLWDKKVKDYKISERKEELKPAEPLERKVESYRLLLQYEKEEKELRKAYRDNRMKILYGYGGTAISSLPLIYFFIKDTTELKLALCGAIAFFVPPFIICALLGSRGIWKTISAVKKIKGLEKKIKELKK